MPLGACHLAFSPRETPGTESPVGRPVDILPSWPGLHPAPESPPNRPRLSRKPASFWALQPETDEGEGVLVKLLIGIFMVIKICLFM